MRRWFSRAGWVMAGALGIFVTASLAGIVSGGSIDPPGPVGSTMRSLDDLLPAWNKDLNTSGGCSSERYTCVWSNAAFLDRETGLVWERTRSGPATWAAAHDLCPTRTTGGKQGWRLPAIDEILTLVEPGGGVTAPLLTPMGDTDLWWSNTQAQTASASHFAVRPANGQAQVWGNTTTFHVLCVRGPAGD